MLEQLVALKWGEGRYNGISYGREDAPMYRSQGILTWRWWKSSNGDQLIFRAYHVVDTLAFNRDVESVHRGPGNPSNHSSTVGSHDAILWFSRQKAGSHRRAVGFAAGRTQ